MKKNLLSILILALLIVNIALSVITMISVTSTNKATASLVGSIATAINLELGTDEQEEEEVISMADTEAYDIPDSLTIPLKKDADGKDHYAVVTVSLAMNTKDKDYETYGGANIESKVSLIKGEINDVFAQYTKDEAIAGKETIEKEVLERIQSMFDSKFIYKVVMNEVYQ
ncbi:MAG: flagellar basal body-associated FliL family protein [Lachnospiraceae bacterium]|nr:flagellar basal body-associated FliL family protein [Lachnospiraceae bacterium]